MGLQRTALEREVKVLAAQLASIDGELAEVTERRSKVETKLTALRSYLSAAFGDEPESAEEIAEGSGALEPPPAHTNGSGGETPSLRAAIRGALAAKPAKPGDVTSRLQVLGFTSGGNTPLSTRVSNEMHRMMRVGQLRRTPSGVYHLKEKETAMKN